MGEALERDGRRKHAMQCHDEPTLLGLQRRAAVDGKSGWLSSTSFPHLQASFGVRWTRAQRRARHEGLFRSCRSRTATAKKPTLASYRCCVSIRFSTSINAKTFPIASRAEDRCASAILIRVTRWRMRSCAVLAPTFAWALAKPIMCRATNVGEDVRYGEHAAPRRAPVMT
jgi:hypothetical protein